MKSETDLRNEMWKVEKEFGEFHFLKQGSGSPGDRPGFLIWVSSFGFKFKLFYSVFVSCILNIQENVRFSLSNARERPPTRAASDKHGCMFAGSLDLTPTETTPHQPGVQLFPSLLSRAPRVCRGQLRVCHARSVAPSEPHAQGLTSRTHRARVYPMLLCFVGIRVLD